jgi:TRAP-type C4-dicarboxylate transport system substrate-binding protein
MMRRFAALTALAALVPLSAKAADPILIKYAFPAPPGSYINAGGVEPWSKEVMAAADGTIEIKLYPGGSIANFSNAYDRVVNGVAEAAFGTVGSISGMFHRTNVSQLPGLTEDPVEASTALQRLQTKGTFGDEWGAVKVLTLFTVPGTGVHATKPIRTIDDFQGQKVSSGGKIGTQILSQLGAAPVSITPSETYQALQRGLVTGATMSWAGVTVFKLDEVSRYHLDVPFGLAASYMIMNKDFYAKLPDKARAAIERYSGEPYARRLGQAGANFDKQQLDRLRTVSGQQFFKFSPRDEERFTKLVAPVIDEWIKETPDGVRVLAAFKAELATLRSGK